MNLGEMTVPGYRFVAVEARMYRWTNAAGRAGWGFAIFTDDTPVEEPPEDDEAWGQYPYMLQLTTEQEPIPLPVTDDLTGVDFALAEPTHPDGGDYFLFTPLDSQPVSDVRIRFLERADDRYRIELTGTSHDSFDTPTAFRYAGWVEVTDGPNG